MSLEFLERHKVEKDRSMKELVSEMADVFDEH
jgi:hypothetical protein